MSIVEDIWLILFYFRPFRAFSFSDSNGHCHIKTRKEKTLERNIAIFSECVEKSYRLRCDFDTKDSPFSISPNLEHLTRAIKAASPP
jgi:hypothetical protein